MKQVLRLSDLDDAGLVLKQAVLDWPSAICVTDPKLPDNPIAFVNPAFVELTGYSFEEAVGRNCRFLQGPGTDLAEVARMDEALREGRVAIATLLSYRKDGGEFWNRVQITPVKDDDGRLVYHFGTQRDVSEQVRADALLQEVEAIIRQKLAPGMVDRDLAAAFAAGKAGGIAERVGDREALARRLRQQALVASFAKAAMRGLGRQELYDRAAAAAVEGLGCEFSKVLVLDGPSALGNLRLVAGVGWRDGVVGSPVPADERSPAGRALRTGTPVVDPDLRHEERHRWLALLREHGAVSALNTPIETSQGGRLGVLEADSREPMHFSPEDVAFMQSLAAVVGSALERAGAEEQRALLMDELDHRVKNTLARVQAIVVRSDRPGLSKDALKRNVVNRIRATAVAHDALVSSGWRGVDMARLIGQELAAYDAPDGAVARTKLAGPGVTLAPQAAASLALALHELTTNAAKHGALSTPSGRIEVDWSLDSEGGLRLRWREAGGPATSPPAREGFGLTLLKRALIHEVGGEAALTFEPEGVVYKARLPASALASPAGPPRIPPTPKPAPRHPGDDAARREVLVVEDDYLIGGMVQDALEAAGWTVHGPAGSVARALEIANAHDLDAALLDFDLGSRNSEAIADLLTQQGVPFAFATGYGGGGKIPERFEGVPKLRKPYEMADVLAAAERLRQGHAAAGQAAGSSPGGASGDESPSGPSGS